MKTPDTIMIFTNGNTACFDEKGNQIAEIQFSWLELYFQKLESLGINPNKVKNIEMSVNGRNVYAKPIRLEEGWNVSFSEF